MNHSEITINDIIVDVVIKGSWGRRVAYGVAGLYRPFRAMRVSTSPYLGHGKLVWRVVGEFSDVEKRVIARAINKSVADTKGAVSMSKKYKTRKEKHIEYVEVTLPERR